MMRPLDLRIGRVERRLEHVQGLLARIYEAGQDPRGQLARIRAAADYEEAYGQNPLISVRIATYNRSALLCERAVRSLRRQTYEHWEAVIVGDACTDDTAERISALGDPRIRFENLPFRGPYPDDPRDRWMVIGARAMNRGMELARGAWIAAVDDDDEMDPDHLEVLLEHARRTGAEVAYGTLRILDSVSGRLTGATVGTWPVRPGGFAFPAALVHSGLRQFTYDPYSYLADQPGDWNLARRLWDAGVRFSFLDRPVGTYYYLAPPPR